MKHFLKMIETVKRQESIPVMSFHEGHVNEMEQAFDTGMFFHYVERCVPFVFLPKDATEFTPTIEGTRQGDNFFSVDNALDSPFWCFSIELLGERCVTVHEDPVSEAGVNCLCILVVENVKDRTILPLCLFKIQNYGVSEFKVAVCSEMIEMIRHFVDRINAEAIGTEHIRQRVKVGKGKSKKTLTIRRVVHVKPKSNRVLREYGTRDVDWSHRWFVRGHWMRFFKDDAKTTIDFDRIGKDRNGDYCVAGRTWRESHEKGPDDKPLINKTHIVKD